MKKINSYLITCAVAAAATTSSYAAVLVEDLASSINLSVPGGEANGYLASADTAPESFTMTGGSITVTNTGDFAARGIYSDNLAVGGAVVNISGGTMTVSDGGGTKDVDVLRMNDHDDSLTVSGGIFNGTETGDGGLYMFRLIRDGGVNISGGTFNFSQNTSDVGGIFVGGGAAAPIINLSGGLFNNLDQFDTHIILDDAAVMNFDVLSLTDTGLTYTGDVIDQTSGTITGTLADGNAFSFVFETLDARNQITVNTVPEPSSAALIGLGGFALILRRRK